MVASAAFVFRRTRAIAAFAGALLAVAIGQYVSATSTTNLHALQRAYIEEVYFERRGAMDKRLPGITNSQPRLLKRRDAELALPPDFWPF